MLSFPSIRSLSLMGLTLGFSLASTLSIAYPSLKGYQPSNTTGTPENLTGGATRLFSGPLDFTPPDNITAPDNRQGAAHRGSCQKNINDPSPLALAPMGGLSLTHSAYPTFYWYLPDNVDAKTIEFILRDDQGENVFTTQYQVDRQNSRNGIFSLSLPEYAMTPPLEIGKNYSWTLSVSCDVSDHSGDTVMKGQVQRIPLSPEREQQLQSASSLIKLNLYAQSQLWHETMGQMLMLYDQYPNNPRIQQAWRELMQSAKLSPTITPAVPSQR